MTVTLRTTNSDLATFAQRRGIVLPKALYSCADQSCRVEYSFPPDDLTWWAGKSAFYQPGFYCFNCLDEVRLEYYADRTDLEFSPSWDVDGLTGPKLSYVLEAEAVRPPPAVEGDREAGDVGLWLTCRGEPGCRRQVLVLDICIDCNDKRLERHLASAPVVAKELHLES